jgi:hypothetical protein
MSQAGTVVIAIRGDEDLGFVHKAAEGLSVDDTVAVALELVANPVRGLGSHASGATLTGPVYRASFRLVAAGT